MIPELQTLALVLLFGCGGAVVQSLGSLQVAIRKGATSQKEVALDADIDQSQLTRKLKGQGHVNLSDIEAMPAPVQRWFHFEEVCRLGLPEEIKTALKIARVIKREQKRSA